MYFLLRDNCLVKRTCSIYLFRVCGAWPRLAELFGTGDVAQCTVERLGKIYDSETFGTGGYAGEERFHRRIRRTSNLAIDCPISFCDIPAKFVNDAGELELCIVAWPVVLPRDLARALINAGHANVFGDDASRSAYWVAMLKDHPMDIVPRSTVPLSIYGDEATIFKQSVMCLHWQSELNPRNHHSLISKFLLAIIPSDNYWVAPWIELHLFCHFFLGCLYIWFSHVLNVEVREISHKTGQVDGINCTSQALMGYIVSSLNEMADDGCISKLSGLVDESLEPNVSQMGLTFCSQLPDV